MSRTRWAGRWGGEKQDERYCRAAVYSCKEPHQCCNEVPSGVEWCGTHSDTTEARREEKVQARLSADSEKWRRKGKRRARRNECEQACNGIADPVAAIELAREALTLWREEDRDPTRRFEGDGTLILFVQHSTPMRRLFKLALAALTPEEKSNE